MRICIPPPDREAGGSKTFRAHWRHWLTQQGIDWIENPDADTYDILFVNAWQTPYPQVYRHKQRLPQMRVVQRVDGAGKDYGRTDLSDAMQHAVNSLADFTIFQSEYSRTSTRESYHVITQDGPVIYNPVDADCFTPEGEKLLPQGDKPRFMTAIWSPNRRKGAWRLPILARENPDFEFVFIGNAEFENIPANLVIFEAMEHDELPDMLRSADVFLNLSENDPCPNIVIEAMASGLPVLYNPGGGTPELVGESGGLPVPVNSAFRPQAQRILARHAIYQHNARARVLAHFTPDLIFPRYLEAIESAQRRAMPSTARHLFSCGQMVRLWVWDKIVNYRDWMPV